VRGCIKHFLFNLVAYVPAISDIDHVGHKLDFVLTLIQRVQIAAD